ncbi:GAF domain-containing protein [Chitinophaga costaii]|uniref:GAF domain-containing protein n=1 Tax=Chitinophaga costaii TaxID=1335309 RepID=A0A1C4BE09_9BACT|nr:GAF domain-containing protein [Chitinophaga costaii]PUZ27650.1 GAF domain-containing protein [Chitinophaga costaii]SCC04938.1 GAF domain-containing protein [Chitinophaga costaii]
MHYTSNIPASLLPDNEKERLQHLYRYEILNTAPEEIYDNIARKAMGIFNTPIACVNFVDRDHVFFKSHVGDEGCTVLPRYASFCSIAIHNRPVTVFPDTHQFPQLRANPFANGINDDNQAVRFYVGAPLRTPEGTQIGTVCAVDNVAHPSITEAQALQLFALASQVMDELNMRLRVRSLLKGKSLN